MNYNLFIEKLKQFADANLFITSFSHGDPSDVDLEKDSNDRYPLMHVVLEGLNYNLPDDTSEVWDWAITIVDRPTDKEQALDRQKEVLSDTMQVAKDLLTDIYNGFNVFDRDGVYMVEAANMTPLIEESSNVLSGVLLQVSITVAAEFDACNLPLEGVTPQPPVVCDPVDVLRRLIGGGTELVQSVPSGGEYTIELDDVVDQNDVKQGEHEESRTIKVMNSDITGVVNTATETQITVDTITPSGIQYQRPAYQQWTKYTTSTNDEGDNNQKGVYIFNRPVNPEYTQALLMVAPTVFGEELVEQNTHSHRFRFTGRLGGYWSNGSWYTSAGVLSNYATEVPDNIIQDHLTGLEYYDINVGSGSWENAISYCNGLTTGGDSDWRLVAYGEFQTVVWGDDASGTGLYNCFNTIGSQTQYWTSTTYVSATTSAITFFKAQRFSNQSKTNTAPRTIAVRTFA
jgi:hypothetical protein